jgi:hypothetical protein
MNNKAIWRGFRIPDRGYFQIHLLGMFCGVVHWIPLRPHERAAMSIIRYRNRDGQQWNWDAHAYKGSRELMLV